ncbi:uncharacterized protein LOC115623868 [Scaptodrosophila lebanonensis]|uniref:Uncharacterized protein LOC115623868 n=1 Tax=Drosophila lebanonensis TaxID=7225 RepID=A0A6J2TGQ7_DROLE|nr:uncharacterized protein LOC115623868 [Scaptodrosophila lebanonensis]
MSKTCCVNLFDKKVGERFEKHSDKLCEYYKDSELRVQELRVLPGTAKGDNFASIILRINVKYSRGKSEGRTDSVSFLVKTSFAEQDLSANVVRDYNIYIREMDMYEIILPKLALLLKELGDESKLFASTVNVDREVSAIMFEDMLLENYGMACRFKRLDLQHTQLVLEKLATFHAIGAVLNEREPGIYAKNFDRGIFNRYTRGYQPIMEQLFKYGERTTDVNDRDFMTLAHGDVWTMNVMFQYDAQQRPSNAILIDFQFSVWCSPTIDLHYLLNTSLPEPVRLQDQPKLVQYYYYKLVEVLKKLRYAGYIPSLFEFQRQFEARAFYGLFGALVFQPVQLYQGQEKGSIEIILSEDESAMQFKDSVFQNDVMINKLHRLLPFFDRKGLLDDMH